MMKPKSGIFSRMAMALMLLGSCLALSGCVAAATSAGVAAVAAGSTEKGFGASVSDGVIRLKINETFISHNASLFANVSTSVNDGSVLLTGNINTPEDKVEATQLVWQINGVVEVLNELNVNDTSSIKNFAKDLAAGAQLRAKLIGDGDISSLNFSIDVVNGTVFLSGIASSEDEINKVVEHARSLRFATDVKNYIRVNDDDRE